MKRDDFFQKLREIFSEEETDLNEMTNLKDLEEYDSLSIIPLIALINEHFNKTFTAVELYRVTTVKTLMELIGLENFE